MCFLLQSVKTQDYKAGFAMLEEGSFEKASVFFKSKLDSGASDFTARLCYGRAIGLSGKTNEALSIFQEMKTEFPEHFELELNYAESFMWAKRFHQAKERYAKLYKKDSTSFAAVLGYANALSSLHEYADAAYYIDKALQIDSDNPNALISRKYILLGYANAAKLAGNYSKAEQLLMMLEDDYINDLDIRLAYIYLKLDQNDLSAAEKLTKEAIKLHPSDYRPSLILSSLKLRKVKFTQAQELLDSAKAKTAMAANLLPFDIQSHEFNIQLSRQDFKKAKAVLKRVKDSKYSDQYREMKINYFLAKNDYRSVEEFVEKQDNKDLYLFTMAKISIQKGQYREARKFVDQLSDSEQNKITKYYLEKEIDRQFYHYAVSGFEVMKDNGGNYAEELNLRGATSRKNRGQIYFAWNQRKVLTNGQEAAKAQKAEVGLMYNFYHNFSGQFNIGYNTLENTLGDKTANFQYFGNLKYQFNNSHTVSLAFLQNTFDYNADLINNSITDNKLQFQYYNMFFRKFGGFIEASHSLLSDKNSSNFTFLSVFYNFTTLPLLQMGVNYTYLTFENDSPYYFSPNSYNVKEVFLKFDNQYHPTQKLIVSVLMGAGQQYINNENRQLTQRLDLSFGYKLKKGSRIMLYYNYNNAASASVIGYKVQRLGVRAFVNI